MRSRNAENSSGGAARAASGLTLVELLVTLSIFLILSLFMFMAVNQVVSRWQAGERNRIIYERASGVLNFIADDLRFMLTQEPTGCNLVRAKFIGDVDPANTAQQRLMLVRSFECGPERAITFNAGDPTASEAMFQPLPDPGDPQAKPPPPAKGASTGAGADFDGMSVGSFKALGGMAMVGYDVKDRVLYRHILAPVQGGMLGLFKNDNGQPLATDVLYLGFDYWSQYTETWAQPTAKSKVSGPEKIWDSTRGIAAPPLNKFLLHRCPESLNDPSDDVFPEKIRITLTVDSPLPRCVYTKTLGEIGDGDGEIEVNSTTGFDDGGDSGYILIDSEWIRYGKKTLDKFVVTQRGARGTTATGHAAGAIIRAGKTFHTVVYVPNYREDFTPDAIYFARRGLNGAPPKRSTR